MINKPQDFDTAQAFDGTNTLPADGYVCIIKKVKETVSKKGNEMIEVALDILEGGYKDFYMKKFKAGNNQKWPNAAIMRVITTNQDGTTNGNFKHFVNCAEESNNFTVSWGEKFCECLKGKAIGCLFGREEFEASNGDYMWATKAKTFKRVNEIRNGEFEIPKDKPLKLSDRASESPVTGFRAVDEDIPF